MFRIPLHFVEELNKWNRAKHVVVFNDGFRGNDGVNSFVNEKIVEMSIKVQSKFTPNF